MNNRLTYREQFTCEMIWGGVPTDTEYVRNSTLFQDGLKRYDSGEWKYLEKEIWKDIKGYEGYYKISNHGRLKSISRDKIYKTRNFVSKTKEKEVGYNSRGYKCARLVDKNGNTKSFRIHRIVALMFIHNKLNKPYINHINGIKTDNHASNLEWCTQKENVHHAHKTKLYVPKTGAENHSSKLNIEQVLEIDSLFKKGISTKEIANKYNITRETVNNVLKRKTYKNIKQ